MTKKEKLGKKKKVGKEYYNRYKVLKTKNAAIRVAKYLRGNRWVSGERITARVFEGIYKKEMQFGVYTK